MERVSTITALFLCTSLKEKCESCSSLERRVVGTCSSGVRWTLCTQRHPHVLLTLVSCAGRGGRGRIYNTIALAVCSRPLAGVSIFLAVLDT